MNVTGTVGATVARSTAGQGMDLRSWVRWLLASTTGGLVALSMAAELPWGVGTIPSGDPANVEGYSVAWAVILAGLLAGAALGGMQWLLLRRWFSARQSSGRWWVAASALGFASSFTAAWALSGRVAGDEYAHHGLPHAVDRAETWGGLLIAAVLGIVQWLVLSVGGSEALRLGRWWLPVSTVGFLVAWWAAAVLSAPIESTLGPMTHFWGGALFGVVFGTITGSGFAWLSRRTALADSHQDDSD